MDPSISNLRKDRRSLQQVIAGLTDGVVFVEPDQNISWANTAALRMHGVESVEDLGGDVEGSRTTSGGGCRRRRRPRERDPARRRIRLHGGRDARHGTAELRWPNRAPHGAIFRLSRSDRASLRVGRDRSRPTCRGRLGWTLADLSLADTRRHDHCAARRRLSAFHPKRPAGRTSETALCISGERLVSAGPSMTARGASRLWDCDRV